MGFYWIYDTVARFGGFGPIVSGLIFALYVMSGAILFVVFAWTYHNLGPTLDAFALRSPIAIVVAELVTVRLFYWHFGHTQVAFTPFVQIAGLGGAMLVSFVMFWLAEVGVRVVVFGERRRAFVLPVAAFAIALGYGTMIMSVLAAHGGEKQEIVLVQGPPALSEKRELDAIWQNLARLFEMSRESARPGIPGCVARRCDPRLYSGRPRFGRQRAARCRAWRTGRRFWWEVSLTTPNKSGTTRRSPFITDGTVPAPYFKRILIPFGEYMPFSSVIPWLNRLNDNAGLFSSGREITVFPYPMRRQDRHEYTARVAPLICYEDTVTAPAREATRRGAELLVNLTYDTWFGRTAAPYQHHLIAIFRAIENRRYLVRSTYTGYTAVVSPLGKTIAHIPAFTEGRLAIDVPLMTYQSSYTSSVGERPWWGLLAFTVGSIVVNRRKKRPRS